MEHYIGTTLVRASFLGQISLPSFLVAKRPPSAIHKLSGDLDHHSPTNIPYIRYWIPGCIGHIPCIGSLFLSKAISNAKKKKIKAAILSILAEEQAPVNSEGPE